MTATTMTATNMFSEEGMTVNSLCVGRFLKSTPLVFHVFIVVAVMAYLVVVGLDHDGHKP